MAEERMDARRRRRRSTATLERLEAARRRRAEQLERERENERRVDAALEPFAEAAAGIEAVERKRDDRVDALRSQLERKLAELDRQKAAKVAEYERQVEQARADADMEIGQLRTRMAASVREIRASDVSVSETAELLGISVKTVSALSRQDPDDNEAMPTGAPSTDGRASAIPAADQVVYADQRAADGRGASEE